MKKNLLLIIGILLIIVGVVFAGLANFPLSDATGFAVTMFGAGLAAATVWGNRDQKSSGLFTVLAIVLIGCGAFILGFMGFAENQMTMIITSVFGVVSIIMGLIFAVVQKNYER